MAYISGDYKSDNEKPKGSSVKKIERPKMSTKRPNPEHTTTHTFWRKKK